MKGVKEVEAALKTKSLTALTQALSELCEELAYQLKPPYTEILQFRAQEESERFAVEVNARLYLHYASLGSCPEGLVFTISFGGPAIADSPAPPIHELFYAALVESFQVHGYGSGWQGAAVSTPAVFLRNLEVNSKTIAVLEIDGFFQSLKKRS